MVTPYIVFHGTCADALAFYCNAFETEVSMQQPYGDYVPEGCTLPPDTLRKWVMHAEMQIEGTAFWFADEVTAVQDGNAVRLTVTVATKSRAQKVFDALSAGGQIPLPPTETFYSAFHASVTDRFGVCWNIVAEERPEQTAV